MKEEAFCIETATLATKGEKLLRNSGIGVRMVRSDCGGRAGGCAFELRVGEKNAQRSAGILRQASIPVISRRSVGA